MRLASCENKHFYWEISLEKEQKGNYAKNLYYFRPKWFCSHALFSLPLKIIYKKVILIFKRAEFIFDLSFLDQFDYFAQKKIILDFALFFHAVVAFMLWLALAYRRRSFYKFCKMISKKEQNYYWSKIIEQNYY